MADQVFHLNLKSAEGLKDVNLVTNMATFAIASLCHDPRSKKRTSVDKNGGKSPTWNCHLKFRIPTANPNGLVLHIQLKSKGTLCDSDVGEVHIPIPIDELLLLEGTAKSVSCPVINPSGNPEGILNISYHIGVEVAPPQPPGTAYPAAVAGSNAYPPAEAYHYPPPAGPYPYRPPQPAYVYGAPQPQQQPGYWYGYPPQAQPGCGYGYPPQPPQPPGTAYPAAVAGSNAYPPAEAYHYPPPAGPYPYRPPQPAYGYGAPQPQLQL